MKAFALAMLAVALLGISPDDRARVERQVRADDARKDGQRAAADAICLGLHLGRARMPRPDWGGGDDVAYPLGEKQSDGDIEDPEWNFVYGFNNVQASWLIHCERGDARQEWRAVR